MSKLLPILLDQFALSRRRFLRSGAALTMAGIAGTNTFSQAFAKGPLVNTQAPNFYRFKLGGAEATIVTDGVLPLGEPHAIFTGLTREEMDRQLRDNFLAADNVSLEQNILVLNTGDKLVVFDTGLGSLKGFGPATGKMMSTLKQAGIDPKHVDAIVMSHAHVDHCGGCMADDGSRNFPNAQYYISQLDYEFWTTEKNVPAQFKVFWDTATKNLVPNRDRMVFIQDGQEFLPGIRRSRLRATPSATRSS
jgi:glyoxylase-like metal-dependent hydrolase (beta-lactamase superfamily II)